MSFGFERRVPVRLKNLRIDSVNLRGQRGVRLAGLTRRCRDPHEGRHRHERRDGATPHRVREIRSLLEARAERAIAQARGDAARGRRNRSAEFREMHHDRSFGPGAVRHTSARERPWPRTPPKRQRYSTSSPIGPARKQSTRRAHQRRRRESVPCCGSKSWSINSSKRRGRAGR